MVSPQDVVVLADSSVIVIPFFLVGESSHVIPYTEDFLLGELNTRSEKHNGFIPMTLEVSLGIVLVNELTVIDVNICILVLVNLTQVMEHTYNDRAFSSEPLKLIIG